MKSKFWMVAVAMLALVLGGVAMLFGLRPGERDLPYQGWHGHRGHRGYLMRELNLTDAQKAQVKEIFQANKQTGLPLMQQMAANKKAMLEATANGTYDQAKIQGAGNSASQLMSQMIVQKRCSTRSIPRC